ncbi:MAG TPA: tRNA (N6-threonylcarbamoyladenosine(37)-N6)-methyltransferase TrmO [Bacteroidota bacterium]|nr:tRNA (N6-threonylcarbamoyladenosine(37)-N6)-methyltransferase TrmO [Bacteroidota bacterium]
MNRARRTPNPADRISLPAITLSPIGIIRTPYSEKYDAPRQPDADGEDVTGVIELIAHRNFEQALEDLAGFERIWIVSWFDRNTAWKPKVLPPRANRTKRGVFATRSPHRPNPIGLSVCRLIEVKGLTVCVANPDLLDRTPILDLKPYIAYADAFPDSGAGWLADAVMLDLSYEVEVSRRAREQDAWLAAEGCGGLIERACRVLGRDPFPHPYRRTAARGDNLYELAYKAWRICYRIEARRVSIVSIESGYEHVSTCSYDDSDPTALSGAALHARYARETFSK